MRMTQPILFVCSSFAILKIVKFQLKWITELKIFENCGFPLKKFFSQPLKNQIPTQLCFTVGFPERNISSRLSLTKEKSQPP